MQAESRFKLLVRPKITAIPNSIFFKIQQRSLRGIPDLIGVINGRFVAIELKVQGNRADPLQMHYLKKIAEAGGLSFVMHPENVEEVLTQLRALNGPIKK
jgi:penicillin-binding protein-related factor A (putative recombinase)